MNRFLMLLPLCVSLVGCATYDNKFDCPYGKGLGCASLSKVNKMVDRNQVDLGDEEEERGPKKQLHIYYGPNHMGKVVTVDQPSNYPSNYPSNQPRAL